MTESNDIKSFDMAYYFFDFGKRKPEIFQVTSLELKRWQLSEKKLEVSKQTKKQ